MLKGPTEDEYLEPKGAKELADAAMVSRSAWYRRMAAEGRERPAGAPWIRCATVFPTPPTTAPWRAVSPTSRRIDRA